VGVVELISLGYTTLRAPAGHLIVVPNSVAASQVTINLNTDASFTAFPLVITIRVGRNTDIEAARELALKVAKENGEEKAIAGCFLTKVEATAMTLELRLHASDAAHRDALRSKLLAELARRFVGAHLGAVGAEAATFA